MRILGRTFDDACGGQKKELADHELSVVDLLEGPVYKNTKSMTDRLRDFPCGKNDRSVLKNNAE